jgi:type I restriction enzyme, S subunit
MSWPEVEIGTLGKVGSGTTPKRGTAGYYGGSIPWIKSGELNADIIQETDEKVTQLALDEHTALKMIPRGAILVAMYGATVGQVAFLDIEATSNQAVCHIIPDTNLVDARFLFHALIACKEHWLSRRVGGGQPNISMKIVKETKIRLPPIEEQKKTAEILDKIMIGKDNAKILIQGYDDAYSAVSHTLLNQNQ